MNNELIKNWNTVVQKEDIVYILGDFAMLGKSQQDKLGSVVSRLKGKKILIMGNHDELNPDQYIKVGFHQVIYPYLEVKPGWYCYHDPSLATCIKDAEVHLVGHVHTLFDILPQQRMINVGMDIWDYHPVSEEQIESVILNKF